MVLYVYLLDRMLGGRAVQKLPIETQFQDPAANRFE
jgi:hypothetical protein